MAAIDSWTWTFLWTLVQIWILLELVSRNMIWFLLSARWFFVLEEILKYILSRSAKTSQYFTRKPLIALILRYKSLQITTNFAVSTFGSDCVIFSVICMCIWTIVNLNYVVLLSFRQGEFILGILALIGSVSLFVWMFWVLKQGVEFTDMSEAFISSLLKRAQKEYNKRHPERLLMERILRSLSPIKVPLGIFYHVNRTVILVLATLLFESTNNFIIIRRIPR